MSTLREVVELSRACVRACEEGDLHRMSKIMRERDAAYLDLGPTEAKLFLDWGYQRITEEEIDALTSRKDGAS